MNKTLRRFLLTVIVFTGSIAPSFGQGWSYVGAPYINQTVGTSTYLYFGDLEMNVAGDMFVGFWQYNGELRVARYTAGAWSLLPSPGTYPVSIIDLEVKGNNYYMAYSGVRGTSSYAFVKKYNGTSWDAVGDSILLGNSGSGGWFEFLLDNNEVPTILGGVSAPFADKQMRQYIGGTWTTLTLSNTAATIFRENSALFDAQNKLLVVTQGQKAGAPFNILDKIDAGVRTTVGDTLFTNSANSRVKLDGAGTPYLLFNSPIISRLFAYKLNGATWSFIADTTAIQTTMINADVSSTGKVFFTTLQTQLSKSVSLYENNMRKSMDSINLSGFGFAGAHDLIIPPGSNDVYVLAAVTNTSSGQDFSVIKHAAESTGILSNNPGQALSYYPNPSDGKVIIQASNNLMGTEVRVYNAIGALVHKASLSGGLQVIDLSNQPKDCYFIQTGSAGNNNTQKLLLH